MPKYRITAPDGKTFDVEGEGTAEEALAHIQSTYQAAPEAPQEAPQQQSDQPRGTDQMAAAETGASLLSGAVAAPIAGLAGLGAAATRKLGLTQTEPADVVRKVQDSLTYQPRTQQGQKMLETATYPLQKLAQGADYLGGKTAEATDSPALGAAVNTATQAIPALVARGRFGNGRSSPNRPGSSVGGGTPEAVRAAPAQAERSAGLAGVSEAAPSIEQLRAQSKEAYQRASDAGITVADQSLKRLKGRIVTDLTKDGLDPTLHPSTTAAVKRIVNSKGNLSLEEVETLRRIAQDAQKSQAPADVRLASKVVDHIDDFVENLGERDVITGNPAAAGALKEARGLYSRMKKAEEIENLVERAKISAPNFSGSGMENALRTEFRALAKNERKMRRFSPSERAAIKKVAVGGPMENSLRYLGKLAPTGGLSTYLGLGVSAAIPGGIAVPIVGGISRLAANRMTMRNVNSASELVRAGPQNALKEKIPKRNALVE